MVETMAVGEPDLGSAPRLFVSYATTDRKQALAVCTSIENRGVPCWIATRDVAPGANYQEAIVGAIRNARALLLIFSPAANNSDEIKKELSLASRYQVPIIALRIADVEPSDAFAYELSTRQWIDAFTGLDRALEAVVGRIAQLSGEEPLAVTSPAPVPQHKQTISRGQVANAATVGALLVAGVAGYFWLRPQDPFAHSMSVRLAGFQLLSPELPVTLRGAVDAEISAAFSADGVVGVSTGAAPVAGKAPAYALGGTIQREGDTVRVITRLTNERSAETLWSDTFNYGGEEIARVPRHIAVDAGNVVRCGLFGASTYRKPLPDAVMRDYLQFCQGHWDPNLADGRKALIPAQRVVAALPDFSWGWAGVAGAYWKVALTADDDRNAAAARASGRAAADKAIAIDGRNSEALYIKSVLTDRQDWIGREHLFQRAIAAQRLDCGCEHHQYGLMLIDAGRLTDGLTQLRQANDMLALYVYTPLTLAYALVAAGKPTEARTYFNAARDLAPTAVFAERIAIQAATATGNVEALSDPKLPISADVRVALVSGYRAARSNDAGARAAAVSALLALPEDDQRDGAALLLGILGAHHEAFVMASRLANRNYHGSSLFWYPGMRGALSDPAFPKLAEQLGLLHYWKATRTKPDVCSAAAAPPFCRMI